ncbi:MAG: hypothetical protein R3A45_01720 [Bdellovibrionota bacterium]
MIIDKNRSIGQVTKRPLQQEGVLKHPLLLKVKNKVTHGKDKKFRSGTAELQRPSSIQEIIHTFTKAKWSCKKSPSQKAYWLQMIADLLIPKGITSQAFLRNIKNKTILTG